MNLVTVAEAAVLVGRSPGTVSDWRRRGKLRAVRVTGPHRCQLFDLDDVKRVAAEMDAKEGSQKMRHRNRRDQDPTKEELEALIAEQMKPENLPRWWGTESQRMQREFARE